MNWTDSLTKMEASDHMSQSQSPKSLVAKEEKRIQDIQARISQLGKRVRSLISSVIAP
jgi:hypothetical protein